MSELGRTTRPQSGPARKLLVLKVCGERLANSRQVSVAASDQKPASASKPAPAFLRHQPEGCQLAPGLGQIERDLPKS
ncbi:hypothetical protein MPL3356_110191 [Mesorhizobium plurifarium]|uniref:Uncharacterized protein n=1 Tax=Mesorhizobium plurifarium TaxID=69974 RepID=A0A090DEK7_MESPL|nr:hypothetical protein MPL3356_110191 [Mesorhizobium plurifarium]